MEVFCSLHQSIVACMENICSDGPHLWSPDSLTDESGLKLAISTCDFICALVITIFCLKYLQALTSNLQAESKDIVTAVGEVDNVIATLQNARYNIDTYHSRWFATVEKMCTSVGTECFVPRRCSCQIHRSNIPAFSPSQFYCRLLSIPLLDLLLSEIRSRFGRHQQIALLGRSILPSVMVTQSRDESITKVILTPCTSMTFHLQIASAVSWIAGISSGSNIKRSMANLVYHQHQLLPSNTPLLCT